MFSPAVGQVTAATTFTRDNWNRTFTFTFKQTCSMIKRLPSLLAQVFDLMPRLTPTPMEWWERRYHLISQPEEERGKREMWLLDISYFYNEVSGSCGIFFSWETHKHKNCGSEFSCWEGLPRSRAEETEEMDVEEENSIHSFCWQPLWLKLSYFLSLTQERRLTFK